jgi:hypothetical protein
MKKGIETENEDDKGGMGRVGGAEHAQKVQ